MYHRCCCAKTLFGLTAFHCSQINSRTELRSVQNINKYLKKTIYNCVKYLCEM